MVEGEPLTNMDWRNAFSDTYSSFTRIEKGKTLKFSLPGEVRERRIGTGGN